MLHTLMRHKVFGGEEKDLYRLLESDGYAIAEKYTLQINGVLQLYAPYLIRRKTELHVMFPWEVHGMFMGTSLVWRNADRWKDFAHVWILLNRKDEAIENQARAMNYAVIVAPIKEFLWTDADNRHFALMHSRVRCLE